MGFSSTRGKNECKEFLSHMTFHWNHDAKISSNSFFVRHKIFIESIKVFVFRMCVYFVNKWVSVYIECTVNIITICILPHSHSHKHWWKKNTRLLFTVCRLSKKQQMNKNETQKNVLHLEIWQFASARYTYIKTQWTG